MSSNATTTTPPAKKFKRGTIGAAIQELVAKCKINPMQFYILEQALVEACGVQGGMVKISAGFGVKDQLVSETPGYVTARAEVDAILAKYAKLAA